MSFWIALLLIALAALLPLAAALLRPPPARGRREADVALYRAQLAELDREREAGRLDEASHRAARIEVQRRLLAAADQAEAEPTAGRSGALLVALVPLIAAAGLGLYLLRGAPGMPSASLAERAEVRARDEALLAALRARLAELDPRGEQARQGWVLLGNAERSRGNIAAAIEAWERAAAARLDAEIAGEIADAEIQRDRPEAALAWIARGLALAPPDIRLRFLGGAAEAAAGRGDRARAYWQGLIDDAPPDAPWRAMLERRINALP
jgi:cytochrome c-type biogenesis protein CcmH